MTERFPADCFLGVHKSFIINLQKVTQLELNSVLFNRQHIPVGRSHRNDLEKFLGNTK